MHNLPVIGAFIMQKALRPHFGQTRLIPCTAAARLGLSHMRVALPAAGGFLAPFLMYVGISLLYASVAGALVSFVEPLAAGSGIAEVKTYLNGIHIRGLLAVSILSMPWLCHSHRVQPLLLCPILTLGVQAASMASVMDSLLQVSHATVICTVTSGLHVACDARTAMYLPARGNAMPAVCAAQVGLEDQAQT